MCLTHNRWYQDYFECPDCKRDAILDRQTECLEEIASEQSNIPSYPDEIHHTHDHTHKHEGFSVHVNVQVKAPDPEEAVNRAIDQILIYIAERQFRSNLGTFDEWVGTLDGVDKKIIAAALLKALSLGLLTEYTTENGRIVLKINTENPTLVRLVPECRSEMKFLQDLSTRLALAHGITPPNFDKSET